jgi:transposase InsO family protein
MDNQPETEPLEDREMLENLLNEWEEKRARSLAKMKQAKEAYDGFREKDRQREKAELDRQRELDNRLQIQQKQEQNNDRRLQNLIRMRPTKVALKDASEAEEFIKNFIEFVELQLKSEANLKTFLIPLLLHSMKEEPKHPVFFKKLDNEKIPYWDLLALKRVFLDHYAGQGWNASQIAQLANIAMGYEKPADYIGRIMQKAGQLGIRLDMTLDEGSQRMVRGWFSQLPHNVQQSMSADMTAVYEAGTIQTYLDLVQRHVPQKPERVEPCPLYCPYCPNKVDFTCACETMRRLHNKRKTPLQGPKTETPPITQVASKGPNRPSNKDGPKERNPCRRCGQPWSYLHQQKCNVTKDLSAALIDSSESLPGIPEVLGEWERDDLSGLKDPGLISSAFSPEASRNQRRPRMSLKLNGKLCSGLHVDTMSDYSVMSDALLKRIDDRPCKLAIRTENLPTVLSANSTSMVFLGRSTIPVLRENIEFEHEFLISQNLPKQLNCLLGNDILSKIGVELNGLSHMVKQNSQTSLIASIVETHDEIVGKDLGLDLADAISALEVVDNKDSSQYFNCLHTYRLRVRDEMETEMKRNENLHGFCTHPAAEILFTTTDENPINVRQYDLPYKHRSVVDNQIDNWLKDGIIEICTAKDHSNNPLLVVPKRDLAGNIKDWRTCIDPRLINNKIIDSAYPIPKARHIFDKLAGCKIFTVIDLKSGFNQIQVKAEHRKKTAFTWNKRVYQFVGAPFGFKNIPQDFQRIMDNIFEDLDCVTVYLDDIVIGSSSYSDHVRDVKAVIAKLNAVNMRLSPKKLKLAHDQIIVIGNKVSRDGVTVAIEKLEKMEHWKGPVNTLKQLQQRLGFTNYFREYCPLYAKLMAPLEQLRTQGKIVWTKDHENILNKFRDILNEQVMISYPDFSKPLIVATDASKYGLGCVLFQLVGHNDDQTTVDQIIKADKRYIRFASRALTASERNYGAPQRELLGVLFALKSFRPYLFGYRFRLFTDHQALTYMLERPKVSSVIFNWLDEILTYDFKMEHVPGLKNILPDRISRIYDFDDREPDTAVILSVSEVPPLTTDMDDLEVIEDSERREMIMSRAHAQGHFGAADMARTIRSTTRATWPNLVKDCQKLVSACIPCQRYNVGRMGYHPPKSLQALLPFDHVCIDLKQMPLSKRGNMFYLVLIDVATRFIFLRELSSKSSYSVAQALLRLFCDIGFPKVLQSDNGGEFVNEVMSVMKKISGIDERLISAYHHRSNGIAERAIQSTSHAVYKSIGGLNTQWDDYLPHIQHAFNTRVIELHGSSPYSLMFGRAPNTFSDYRDTDTQLEKEEDRERRLIFLNSIVFPAVFEKVGRAHSKRQEYFAKTHRMLKEDFPAGAQVMVRDELKSAKHQPTFEGPFTVLRRKMSGNYELKGIDGTTYVRSPWVLKLVSPEIMKGINVSDTLYAAVDYIVEHRDLQDGRRQFRVRWEKQGPELDSWLFQDDFIDYGPLQKYSKSLGVDLRTKNPKSKSKSIQKTPKKTELVDNGVDSQQDAPTAKASPVEQQTASPSVPVPTADKQPGSQLDKPNPIEIYLDKIQKEALGKYWKSTTGSKRTQKAAIVELDTEE